MLSEFMKNYTPPPTSIYEKDIVHYPFQRIDLDLYNEHWEMRQEENLELFTGQYEQNKTFIPQQLAEFEAACQRWMLWMRESSYNYNSESKKIYDIPFVQKLQNMHYEMIQECEKLYTDHIAIYEDAIKKVEALYQSRNSLQQEINQVKSSPEIQHAYDNMRAKLNILEDYATTIEAVYEQFDDEVIEKLKQENDEAAAMARYIGLRLDHPERFSGRIIRNDIKNQENKITQLEQTYLAQMEELCMRLEEKITSLP